MPSFYTHSRFGEELIPRLPADVRRAVTRFPQLFSVGLQGPDFFFYYNPFMKTAVGALGSTFHRQSGTEFFTHAARAADTEAGRAYLYGVLAHYCLDSQCHPFVHQQTDSGPINHTELESEFERFLLARDGKKPPETVDRGGKMKLTRGECVTVSGFYPPASPGQVNQSVKNTARCLKILAWPHGARRRLLTQVLKMAGGSMPHQLIPSRAEPKFFPLNERMMELYVQALEHYPILLEQLMAHMESGTPLGAEFEPKFG